MKIQFAQEIADYYRSARAQPANDDHVTHCIRRIRGMDGLKILDASPRMYLVEAAEPQPSRAQNPGPSTPVPGCSEDGRPTPPCSRTGLGG